MASDDLIAFLEDCAGDMHRGTARYDGESTDVLFLRDDLKERRIRTEIDRILNRVRSESSPKEERSFPFGDLHATVRSFEEATILHFPTGYDRGIVVSLESAAAQDLNTFIGQCIDHIQECEPLPGYSCGLECPRIGLNEWHPACHPS